MLTVPTDVAALVIRHVKLLLADIKNFLVSMLVQHDQFDESSAAGEFLFGRFGLSGFDLRTWLLRFFSLCSWDVIDT